MQILQLRIRIGEHEIIIENCSDENPDVAMLLKAATSSKAVISIEVPQDEKNASATGRLAFTQEKKLTAKGIDEHMKSLFSKT